MSTLSSAFDQDRADSRYFDEIRAVGIVTTPTGHWVIARVINPTDDEDRFRAYAPDLYRERTGLIAEIGPTRENVVRRCKENR